MAVGRVPAAAKVNHYQYLSQCYLETLDRELPQREGGKALVDRVSAQTTGLSSFVTFEPRKRPDRGLAH
ncbi:hypothetical protein HYQ46_012488 [Verticillium longisporum]|nr:hypothetical protein HYQ46_012488 [Verticillium longisporum]